MVIIVSSIDVNVFVFEKASSPISLQNVWPNHPHMCLHGFELKSDDLLLVKKEKKSGKGKHIQYQYGGVECAQLMRCHVVQLQ